MPSFFDALRECDTHCFICFKHFCCLDDIETTDVPFANGYTMCPTCYRRWHYAMGWYAGRYGSVDSSMVNKDRCAEAEMLWDLYHEVVAETGVEEHERTRSVKRAIHDLPETDTLEGSDLFYADLYAVLEKWSHVRILRTSLEEVLDEYGYFGVYDKLLERLKAVS